MQAKTEYPPLFPAGFHDIDRDKLGHYFLDPFADKNHRQRLVDGLFKFLSLLDEFSIDLEVWVDGSFSTTKPNPSDVDIFVLGSDNEISQLNADDQDRFRAIFTEYNETKIRYNCDVSFINSLYDDERSNGRGWFGFTRNDEPKGIPRIWLKT